jgi:16S rRNA (cytidine1402-2'-O)-methyltransferase
MIEDALLFLIPTPIGNLEDITLRALRLLDHYQIRNRIQSYHSHNEHKITEEIIARLKSGDRIAMVSDAGTPGISDPGYLLVNACIDNHILFESLPGPSALIPALIKSGLPSDRFVFEGFLPHKKGRKTRLQSLQNESRTMIFYESPHRLIKCLLEFKEYFGADRRTSVSRELTKKFEETINGSLEEIIRHFSDKAIKGEIVIVIEGIR